MSLIAGCDCVSVSLLWERSSKIISATTEQLLIRNLIRFRIPAGDARHLFVCLFVYDSLCFQLQLVLFSLRVFVSKLSPVFRIYRWLLNFNVQAFWKNKPVFWGFFSFKLRLIARHG